VLTKLKPNDGLPVIAFGDSKLGIGECGSWRLEIHSGLQNTVTTALYQRECHDQNHSKAMAIKILFKRMQL
jgi:hypothetical protein